MSAPDDHIQACHTHTHASCKFFPLFGCNPVTPGCRCSVTHGSCTCVCVCFLVYAHMSVFQDHKHNQTRLLPLPNHLSFPSLPVFSPLTSASHSLSSECDSLTLTLHIMALRVLVNLWCQGRKINFTEAAAASRRLKMVVSRCDII